MLIKYYLRKIFKKSYHDDRNNGNGERITDFKFGKRYFVRLVLSAEEINYNSNNNNNNNNDYGADNDESNNDDGDDNNGDEDYKYVENEYKSHHHDGKAAMTSSQSEDHGVWGYLRINFFSIMYLFIRTVLAKRGLALPKARKFIFFFWIVF
jgi:hypothetical protein